MSSPNLNIRALHGRSTNRAASIVRPVLLISLLITCGVVLRGSLSKPTVPTNSEPTTRRVGQLPQGQQLPEEVIDQLSRCKTFRCLQTMHEATKGIAKFNLPHFFLIGWQKTATTSINSYLRSHPQMLPSVIKEPHYFTLCLEEKGGGPDNPNCFAQSEEIYIQDFLKLEQAVESHLNMATVDASADYAWKGDLVAQDIYDTFPWVKIVIVLREPIARAISYKNMHTKQEVSQFSKKKACSGDSTLFECLEPFLNPETEAHRNYSTPLQHWLAVFPRDQLHVIQFEELTEEPDRVLWELKEFLGLDPDLPEGGIRNVNNRAASNDGWPMKKAEYEQLVSLVRPDAERAAELIEAHKLGSKSAWMKRWESAWSEKVKEACDKSGNCIINSD